MIECASPCLQKLRLLVVTDSALTARELEAVLLNRCAVALQEVAPIAQDQREANVFQLAAMVIRSQFPRESAILMGVSDQYFSSHPNERLSPGEVIKYGWISSLPRLRDMLSRQLHRLKSCR